MKKLLKICMLKQTSKLCITASLCSSPSPIYHLLKIAVLLHIWKRGVKYGKCSNRDSNHLLECKLEWQSRSARDPRLLTGVFKATSAKKLGGKLNSLKLTHVKKLLKNYMLKRTSKLCIPISASPLPLSHAQHSSRSANVRKGWEMWKQAPTQI